MLFFIIMRCSQMLIYNRFCLCRNLVRIFIAKGGKINKVSETTSSGPRPVILLMAMTDCTPFLLRALFRFAGERGRNITTAI